MEFTPRLVQILFLLLKSDKPIKATELAEQLRISKRTIFRELEHVDKQLEKYGVHIKNKVRQGFLLTGGDQQKRMLLSVLEESDSFDPRNKDERQKKLILALMQEEKMQKIYYYADLLQVSEATISHDLEVVDAWFTRHQITLERRAGFGIFLSYEEQNYRNAILSYISKYGDKDASDQELSVLDKNVKDEVEDILCQMKTDLAGQLTKSSYDSLILYLVITVKRIQNRKVIYLGRQEHTMEKEPKAYEFVEEIAQKIERQLWVTLSLDEKISLYIFLKSRKMKYIQKETALLRENDLNVDLRDMIYEMINTFDAAKAYELKQDENLAEGLVSHLRPTITRMLHKMPIQNPLLEDIKANYMEIYKKSESAAKVMERMIGYEVSEEEIGYLALHFGGALTRLEQDKKKKRRVDIGVACASGIGISSLLSSRLIHFFEEKIRITVLTADKIQNGDYENVDLVLDHYNVMTVGETLGVTIEEAEKYAGNDQKELNMIFQFELMDVDGGESGKWNDTRYQLKDVKKVLGKWQKELYQRAWNSLFWGNHDQPRVVSRFGNTSTKLYWEKSAKMLAAALYFLQGTPFIFQGEELGMTNSDFQSIEDLRDIESIRAYQQYVETEKSISREDMMRYLRKSSRDNARTPMQWNAGKNAGFSEGTPWIAVNSDYTWIHADDQLEDKNSIFHYYQKLIQIIKTNEVVCEGKYEEILNDSGEIYGYKRVMEKKTICVLCNFTEDVQLYDEELIPEDAEILLGNYGNYQTGSLRAYEAVVYQGSTSK